MKTCPKCGTNLEPCDMRLYMWCPKCQKYERVD